MITNDREAFIGLNTKPLVKAMLQDEARKRGFSLSLFIDRILTKYADTYLKKDEERSA